ncbi:hypothetical protein [Thermogladius sp.]|uniref:hypothetical protein n=1 Tax=Thermogladius sp. TaxID=2023064 RepID=UPI003D0F07B0
MSVEVTGNALADENEYLEDEERLLAISYSIDVSLSLYTLGSEDEKVEATKLIWASINDWLGLVGPLGYYEGLVDHVSKLNLKKMWEANIDQELIEEALYAGWYCKRAELLGLQDNESLEYCRSVALKLFKALGSDLNQVLDVFRDESKQPGFYSTLIGLALVLSSNA